MRLEPTRGPVGRELGGQILIGRDLHRGGRARHLRGVGARERRHPERPRPRLGVGRTRRVQRHLKLLLGVTAGAIGNQVGDGRSDGRGQELVINHRLRERLIGSGGTAYRKRERIVARLRDEARARIGKS